MHQLGLDTLRGKTALICEDEWAVAAYFKMILTQAGVRVIGMVADGGSCVQEALRKRPDLVLLDINLPEGMNGMDAARQILRTSRISRPCIIMITAYTDEQHRQDALDAGVSGYIVKPVTPSGLLADITASLKSKQCETVEVKPAVEVHPPAFT